MHKWMGCVNCASIGDLAFFFLHISIMNLMHTFCTEVLRAHNNQDSEYIQRLFDLQQDDPDHVQLRNTLSQVRGSDSCIMRSTSFTYSTSINVNRSQAPIGKG